MGKMMRVSPLISTYRLGLSSLSPNVLSLMAAGATVSSGPIFQISIPRAVCVGGFSSRGNQANGSLGSCHAHHRLPRICRRVEALRAAEVAGPVMASNGVQVPEKAYPMTGPRTAHAVRMVAIEQHLEARHVIEQRQRPNL